MNNLEEILLTKPVNIDEPMGFKNKDPEREKLEHKLEEKDRKEYSERDKKDKIRRMHGELADCIIVAATDMACLIQSEAETLSNYTKTLGNLKHLQCIAQECNTKIIADWCAREIKDTNKKLADVLNHSDALSRSYAEITGVVKTKE